MKKKWEIRKRKKIIEMTQFFHWKLEKPTSIIQD